MEKPTSEILKEKLKKCQESNSGLEKDRIRLHRAISWLKCSEEHNDNIDLKFISLWVAFNSCYANGGESDLTEKGKFKQFIEDLVERDAIKVF